MSKETERRFREELAASRKNESPKPEPEESLEETVMYFSECIIQAIRREAESKRANRIHQYILYCSDYLCEINDSSHMSEGFFGPKYVVDAAVNPNRKRMSQFRKGLKKELEPYGIKVSEYIIEREIDIYEWTYYRNHEGFTLREYDSYNNLSSKSTDYPFDIYSPFSIEGEKTEDRNKVFVIDQNGKRYRNSWFSLEKDRKTRLCLHIVFEE